MAENENSERDTHFQGFAKLLWDEINASNGPADLYDVIDIADAEPYIQLIARRAYDLAVHVLGHQLAVDHYRWPALSAQEAIRDNSIPDLTAWPTDPGTSRQTDRPS